jgi:hypothetical protein
MPFNSPKIESIENLAIPLPITTEIRQTAHRFAALQLTREKAEQVLLNTIAVSIVNNYLTMLEIPTDLESSDSWNPVMQVSENVADLILPGVGILECRPVKSNANSCYLPLEVLDSCIGYTVVQIDDSLKKAAILGFTSRVMTEELALIDLQPVEKLLDRVHELKVSNTHHSIINLSQWFDRVFETGWQALDRLLPAERLIPAFGLRNGNFSNSDLSNNAHLTRGKLINLGVQISDRNIVLLVRLTPEENNGIGVTLQVLPSSEQIYLPEALELKVLEASNEVFMQAQARSRDNYIQLQFSGQSQEFFKVGIILNNFKFSEQFQL